MLKRTWFAGVALGAAVVAGAGAVAVSTGSEMGGPAADAARSDGGVDAVPSAAAPSARKRPLAGRTVVLDPGHQLGNRNFARQINRTVDAGGLRKACNTTGTATRGGYPEATLNWQVARQVQRRLRALGARVVLTRTTNRDDRWGPCVDVRGRAGNRASADLMLSIHADGSLAPGARGFHLITPSPSAATSPAVARASARSARRLRTALRSRGVPVANYIAGGDGLDVRSDLGTLNLSRVPVVMVELGNMRSAADARLMTTARGRARYGRALVAGVRASLAPRRQR